MGDEDAEAVAALAAADVVDEEAAASNFARPFATAPK